MKLRASMRGTSYLILAAAFFLGTCGAAHAQDRVVSVKMLAPGVGWAIKGTRLFWTSSNGAQWNNITPTVPSMMAQMNSVFFLDRSTGWVLFSGGRGEKGPQFYLASTTNAGASWSVNPSVLPHFTEAQAINLVDQGRSLSSTQHMAG